MTGGGVATTSPHPLGTGHAVGIGLAIDGYFSDTVYPSNFHPRFSPAWTDAILRWHGLPPLRKLREPFTLVDLGCGDGVSLIMLAAAHPEARFVGIDGLPAHIERGADLAAKIGLGNVEFHNCFFADTSDIRIDAADYVVAQGVLSWISPENRSAVLALAASMLRPGGALTVGYNTLPGWAPVLGFQRLVLTLAEARHGSATERFEDAFNQMRDSGLIEPTTLAWLEEKRAILPRGYFTHEYLNQHWSPLWSGDVISQMSGHGFDYVGQAHAGRLRPDFTLKRAWREALAAIDDPGAREIAADMFLNCCFRTDIYTRGAVPALAPDSAREARLDQLWAAPTAEADAVYGIRTPAGRVGYDNAAAHAILAHLAAGPGQLREVVGFKAADLLNTADALHLANLIVPAEPAIEAPLAAATNAIVALATQEGPLGAMVGAHGVVPVPDGVEPYDAGVYRRLGLTPPPHVSPPAGADGLGARTGA